MPIGEYKRIECDHNAYDVIEVVNEFLEENNIKFRFEIDNTEHDSFDLLTMKEIP